MWKIFVETDRHHWKQRPPCYKVYILWDWNGDQVFRLERSKTNQWFLPSRPIVYVMLWLSAKRLNMNSAWLRPKCVLCIQLMMSDSILKGSRTKNIMSLGTFGQYMCSGMYISEVNNGITNGRINRQSGRMRMYQVAFGKRVRPKEKESWIK